MNGNSFVQIGIWERDFSRGRLKATNRRICFRPEDVQFILMELEMMKYTRNRMEAEVERRIANAQTI